MELLEFDVVILGAGVMGLAHAEALLRQDPQRTLLVAERRESFGQEISSRNSEVIHAGIYYEPGSAKARHCRLGRDLLYAFCERYDVGFRKCGKFIVATEAAHEAVLAGIHAKALANGVELGVLSGKEASARLENASIQAALFSPETGIVDTHGLMARLESLARSLGAEFGYSHSFTRVLEAKAGAWLLELQDPSGAPLRIRARAVINATGLRAATVAAEFGLENYRVKPCRGRYFGLSSTWTNRFSSLLYPVPDPAGGLGVHLTFDLQGRCRLGPDVDWSMAECAPEDPELYRFGKDAGLREGFYQSGQKLLPGLRLEDLSEDYIGARPKLFENGAACPDFRVVASSKEGTDRHLLGIESPGITACLSLAEETANSLLAEI